MTIQAEQFDAIIIGAGIVGCSIARSLAQNNLRTLNVDALPAPGYGSTSHSSAIIRPFYSHVTACAIAHESRYRWLQWPELVSNKSGEAHAQYLETGGLVLVKDGEQSNYAQNIAALDEVGVAYDWLDAEQLLAMYPSMDLQGYGPPKRMSDAGFAQPTSGQLAGGIYLPACGHVNDPQLAARNLYRTAQQHGAQFLFNQRVSSINHHAGGSVDGITLDDGQRLNAKIVVNAAGPHSSRINAMAGIIDSLSISTHAHRHEVAYLRAQASDNMGGSGFLVDLDSGFYQRMDGSDILIGSADPECDPPDIADPDQYSSALSDQWTAQVYRSAQRFPERQIENSARGTVGLYDVSDDWIPIYDKTDLPGYYLAIGTSGNQFKNAPVIGDIMAAIIDVARHGIDHDREPATLELPNLQRSVNLDFYSRLREPQKTNSVLA